MSLQPILDILLVIQTERENGDFKRFAIFFPLDGSFAFVQADGNHHSFNALRSFIGKEMILPILGSQGIESRSRQGQKQSNRTANEAMDHFGEYINKFTSPMNNTIKSKASSVARNNITQSRSLWDSYLQ